MKDELEEQTEPYKPEESDTEPSDIEEDELDELSTQLRTMFCHENLSEISVEPAMLGSNENETQEQVSCFNLELTLMFSKVEFFCTLFFFAKILI